MQTVELPKPGQRIECVLMGADCDPIPPGSRGTVLRVEDMHSFHEHHIHVAWDSGRTLTLITGIDTWRVLTRE